MKGWKRAGAICLAILLLLTTAGTAQAADSSMDSDIDRDIHREFNTGSVPVRVASENAPGTDAPNESDGGAEAETNPSNGGSAHLVIDSQNLYSGMDKSYSEGYLPTVANGTAYVVVPLLCDRALQNNTLRVSLDLGMSQDIPFVGKNYEKNVSLSANSVNGNTGIAESYLVDFSLELKSDRVNGSYPVMLTVTAVDETGASVEAAFTVHVTITDGKDPNPVEEEPEEEPEEPPTFAPKILVESYRCTPEIITAGQEVTVELTLLNTSQSQGVKNMTVTANAASEYMELKSSSDTLFLGNLGAGATTTVSYVYLVKADTPQGQYDLVLSMDYADEKGSSYTGAGKAKLSVTQPIRMQFDPLNFPAEVQVADTVKAQIQAINLGKNKIYHVRAELKADGLNPAGTIYIGDLEAGTTGTGETLVSVSSLSGNQLYGKTEGTVTFYYEDEAGQEYTEESSFTTTITSPFAELPEKKPEDEPKQWWIIMLAIAAILLTFGIFMLVRYLKHKSLQSIQEEQDEAEVD